MTTTHGTAELKKRSVVSSFIFNSQNKVALFQRSDKVSTYRHHLAPISGSIESTDQSPLAAAWRELSEETTLTSTALTLVRQGKSYTFSDPSVKRKWTIYPFMFRLKTPADEQKIKIDWEHEAWGWHDPDQVIKDDTYIAAKGVPRLAESLRRVWFETDLGSEAGRILSKGLDTLAHDHQSGARQLATIALQTLRDVITALQNTFSDKKKWWKLIRTAAWHLSKNGRESMGAAITSAILSALSALESGITASESHQFPTNILNNIITARSHSITALTTTFQSFLSNNFPSSPISLLTLSESSTISTVLTHPSTPTLSIQILESRPLFEGISLASSLLSSSSPHKITLLPDTSPSLACSDKNLDIILIGADRVSSTRNVLNKMGSLPAILTAKFFCPKVKVVVLCETEKIAPPGMEDSGGEEENDSELVSRAWEAGYNSERVREGAKLVKERGDEVKVRNVFFEWVPSELVDVYVTEKGVWTVKEIEGRAGELGKEMEDMFGDL
ncbi:Methylthioribose-1-phosphate isomerase [Podospora fimiseda]|uniref:Methylthioribose-1-phosphate isomerase n=1 Tax=Podospora fimiseda TaxID=252190 RepID=A0AAN7BSH2_9PEZI|nr:Methylthioribose-1-phosphate isomerase [Podospora fimiseda]